MRSPLEFATKSIARLACPLALAAACLATGCATTGKLGSSLLPTSHQVKTGPFVLYSNQPIKQDEPEAQALDRLRGDLASRMHFDEEGDKGPIEVYVLDDRSSFLHLLRFYFPELPPRRAFFLAQGDQRIVYTYHGPMLEEDLRHEASHALLRGRFGDIPLWLDEGLAEYFEAGPDDLQDRDRRLDRIAADLKAGWKPDLRRLEGLDEVHQMDPRDYREAWAWVDLLLSDPKQGTSTLLSYLGTVEARPSLADRLEGQGIDAAVLLAHLNGEPARVVAQKPAARDAHVERVVRMQDPPADKPRGAAAEGRRPGFFRRLGSWLGL